MSTRLRTTLPLALLVVALLVAGYVTGTAPGGPPLDPRSAAPTGTKALLDTLDALGADVRLGARPRADDTAVLVLTDTLDDDGRDAVRAFVRDGGVLLVTDPLSRLAPPSSAGSVGGVVATAAPAECDLPAAVEAGEVRPGPGDALLQAQGEATGCFGVGDGHWLVAEPEGEGVVVALGGPEALTNARLREAGHAVLAVGVLAPDPGTARVTVVAPPRPGEGDATLADLVPGSVRFALAQLGVAFLLVVAWRGRRLARPVTERQPVDLPASELVAATGDLLADARAREHAAAMLRDEARRGFAETCGLARSTPAAEVADVLVARYGVARDAVERVLGGRPTPDDDALVALGREAERLRREILHPARGAPR